MLFKDYPFEVKVDIDRYEFEGYASKFWNVDLQSDMVAKGAFTKTVKERLPKGLIKVLWQHMEPMGLPKHIKEDDKGLYVVAKVSKTRENEDRLQLMRDGVVDRLSIGYEVIKSDYIDTEKGPVRVLKEVKLYEFSPVTFPANEDAVITRVKALLGLNALPMFYDGVKGATTFADLPLADRDREWDATEAEARVRRWAGGPDKDSIDWKKYRMAFFWYDADDPENFRSYKLLFADVINGKLYAIPRGIFAAAGAVQGARGGVDISDSDVEAVKKHISKYYAKMRKVFDDDNIIPPWERGKGLIVLSNEMLSLLLHEAKIGRVLSTANRQLVEAAIEALQALLRVAEPGNSTLEDEEEPLDDDKEKGIDPVLYQSVLEELREFKKLLRR